MKIEYEFYEPDKIMELEPNTLFAESIIEKNKVTFEKFLNSSKMLFVWDDKPVKSIKKLRTKCYILTKDWMIYEIRIKKEDLK